MTDNLNNQTNTESNSSSQTGNSENMIPQSRFSELARKNRELADELQALKDAQAQVETERQKAHQKDLAEQNRYKELYEGLVAEVESLKALHSEVKRYRESFEATLQARIQSIPEEKRALIPEYDDPIKTMAWLDKALPELTAPQRPNAPRLDGGSGGAGSTGGVKPLNATQQQLADLARQSGFNINPERLSGFARNPSKQTDLDNKGDKP